MEKFKRFTKWVAVLPVFLTAIVSATPCFANLPDGTIPDRLVVATREVPPFATKSADGTWSGISIELLENIVDLLEEVANHEIELVYREMELREMLTAVERGQVDVAAAALTVNYERERRMDFTHPYHNSGLGIAVHQERSARWEAALFALVSPTFLKIVATLLLILFTSGVVVYLFERKNNPDHFGGGAMRGIASGIWWAAVTMTTVGYGDKVPRSTAGKMVGFVWMFAGMFIIASFTAAVSSVLTVHHLRSQIDGPADLARAKVATVRSSTSEDYLRSRHITAKGYTSILEALEALRNGEHDAVVYDEPVLQYEVQQQFPGDLQVLSVSFLRQDYAFAVPNGSPLREVFSQILLRRIGSPEWRYLLAGYLGERFQY